MKINRVCPECGREMVIRRNGKTGDEFLGCSGWPECKETIPLPADIEMRRMGAKGLFDDETERG